MNIELIRIDTGASVLVHLPSQIVLTKGVQRGDKHVLERWESKPDSPDWNDAIQSWAYRKGYEVPENGVLKETGPGSNPHAGRPGKVGGSAPDGTTVVAKEFDDKVTYSDAEHHFNADAWERKLSMNELNSIGDYSENTYKRINAWLRYQEKYNPTLDNEIASIDSAIGKSEVSSPVYVFRGISKGRLQSRVSSLSEGGEFIDNGFVSTSLKKSEAQTYSQFVMRILLPKGSKAAYVEDISSSGGEHEVILPRKSHFKISAIQKSGDKTMIDAVYIGAGGKYFHESSVIEAKKQKRMDSKFVWNDGDVHFIKAKKKMSEAARMVRAYSRVREVTDGGVEEATTNVRAQTRHSKKGKVFNVKQHDREVDDAALEAFVTSGRFLETNRQLRAGATVDDPIVPVLDRLISNASVKKATKAYRGLLMDSDEIDAIYDLQANNKDFIDLGFFSTSLSKKTAEKFANRAGADRSRVLIELDIPAGTRAFAVPNRYGENELLFPRKSHFQIRDIIDNTGKDRDDRPYVTIKLRPNNALSEAARRVRAYSRVRKGYEVPEDSMKETGPGSNPHAGRPGKVGGSSKTMYHGTKDSQLDSILAKGIVVQNYNNWGYVDKEKDVYVSENLLEAIQFGEFAAQGGARSYAAIDKRTWAVVEAEIPTTVSLKKDKRVESGHAYTLKEVNPKWIKKIHFYGLILTDKGWHDPKLLRTVVVNEAVSTKTIYIPVPINHPLVKRKKISEAARLVRAYSRVRKGITQQEAEIPVKAHTRHSKTGKVYNVSASTRTIDYAKLKSDVESYVKSDLMLNKNLTDVEWCKGSCGTASEQLAAHLRSIGYDATVVEVVGFKLPLPKDAHPEWLKSQGEVAKKFLYHNIVQVSDRYIDVAGAQYGKRFGGIRILTLLQLKKEWRVIKNVGRHAPGVGKIGEAARMVRAYSRVRKGIAQQVGAHIRNIEVDSLAPATRQFNGKRIDTKNRYSKSQIGKIGEAIAIKLKGGKPVNQFLGEKKNNLAFDVINVRTGFLYEVKAGAISNKHDAQKWRLTKGEPGKKEKEWLKNAPEYLKRKSNASKEGKILVRKLVLKEKIETLTGKKFKVKTLAFILNPDTKVADYYAFDGLHPIIRWHWPLAQKGYKKSFKYSLK